MTNHIIDNSLKDLGKTVLWQYDHALRLLALLKFIQIFYYCAVEQFWDFWLNKVLSIRTCGTFGCSVWGAFVGIPRPLVTDSKGQVREVANSVYRRLIMGEFLLQRANPSFDNLLGYIEVVYGIGGRDSLSKWEAEVSEYGWTTNVDELNSDTTIKAQYFPRLAYKKDTVFIYEQDNSRWLCLKDISASENSSFENLLQSGNIQSTERDATILESPDTNLLKLYDTEGICRKVGGAPKDALTIEIKYEFGDRTVVARVRRRRKCGVTLTDNGDMSLTYGKSEYYDEMHPDQKAIFEQLGDRYLPYPLGIKTNEPVGTWVFGLADDVPPKGVEPYRDGISYIRKEDAFTSRNSFLINTYEEYQRLLTEGAYCLVKFTTDILLPDFWLYSKGNPYYNSIIVRRFTSKAEALQYGMPYDYTRTYRTGEEAIIDFEEIARYGIGGTTGNYLSLYSLADNVEGVFNSLFYKLFGIVERDASYRGDQSSVLYRNGIEYSEGDIFGYEQPDGSGNNWKCNGDITAEENVSFDSIQDKIEKTGKGGPFIDTLAEFWPPYVPSHSLLSRPSIFSDITNENIATTIPDKRLFVGLHNGLYKIFRNTTGGELVVCHSSLETFGVSYMSSVSNVHDVIGVANPTSENLDLAKAAIAIRNGCPIVGYATAISFMPDVLYVAGDVVLFDGEERVFNSKGVWKTEEEARPYTSRQSRSCLHEFYPLQFL